MIALVSPQCLTPRASAGRSIYDLSKNICPLKHPIATLCFSMAVAAAPPSAPPSASHPRRPRRDAAAWGGSGRPRRRGRAADLCGGHGGRGWQQRPWPRKGFRVVLRVALRRWQKGFVHWQVIFVFCFRMLSGTRTCCLRIRFCAGMGLLQFGYKRPNMEGKGMSGTESRRM